MSASASGARHFLLRAVERETLPVDVFRHPLNSNAELHGIPLSRRVGLERLGLALTWIPPRRDSFARHSHANEEEFVFVLSGRGIVRIGDESFEVAHGDFVGFPAGAPAHMLHNPYDEDLVYLTGGEKQAVDIVDFPDAGRRQIRVGPSSVLYPLAAGEPLFPHATARAAQE